TPLGNVTETVTVSFFSSFGLAGGLGSFLLELLLELLFDDDLLDSCFFFSLCCFFGASCFGLDAISFFDELFSVFLLVCLSFPVEVDLLSLDVLFCFLSDDSFSLESVPESFVTSVFKSSFEASLACFSFLSFFSSFFCFLSFSSCLSFFCSSLSLLTLFAVSSVSLSS